MSAEASLCVVPLRAMLYSSTFVSKSPAASPHDAAAHRCPSPAVLQQPACTTPLRPGMHVRTHTVEVEKEVRAALQLLRSRHHMACATCQSNRDCELQVGWRRGRGDGSRLGSARLRRQPGLVTDRHHPPPLLSSHALPKDLLEAYQVKSSRFFPYMPRMRADAASAAAPVAQTPHAPSAPQARDTSSAAVHFDLDKCVLCTRCVRACSELQVRLVCVHVCGLSIRPMIAHCPSPQASMWPISQRPGNGHSGRC